MSHLLDQENVDVLGGLLDEAAFHKSPFRFLYDS